VTEGEHAQCGRCQRLPHRLEGAGHLFVWSPIGHSFGKLVAYLRATGRAFDVRPEAQCVVVHLSAAELLPFAVGAAGATTGEEARGMRVLFKSQGGEPELSDIPKVGSLQQFITMSQSGWLVDMLSEGRLTSHFQPIVNAQDTRQVFAHEALLRGRERDGTMVAPGRMLQLAREADLLYQLDLAARTSAIREVARHHLQTPVFINFTPAAIYDPAYCLRSTVSAISEAGIPPHNVVFEIIESDHTPDVYHLRGIIHFYRQAGFRVALDDLGAGYSSLNLIHQLRPDIVKLDMELIRHIDTDPYKAFITQKLVEIAQKLRIQTVAEGIETPEELRWARTHGVDFVQGYLVARPQSPPAGTTPFITV
jgi:EAL domain-containing protein (putative c-di-GMP-specific phosphodiesterase class I)